MHSLAPFAAHPEQSKGRRVQEAPPSNRSEYQRDRDRIVHSNSFRRLEYKTQVFVNHEGDLFRTRLTHSLEVAQIGRAIARTLNVNEDLTEAISLAHDLGHTPFGHAGQDALNKCMEGYGGFEHNLQSLRLVDVLEEKYAEFDGLNLTFETREGILKHCSLTNAKKLGDIGQRFIQQQQPGLEAQVSNLADEIAYNNHDVDDGLRSGLIVLEQLEEISLFKEQHDIVKSLYPKLSVRRATHEIIRRMINLLISDLTENTKNNLQQLKPQNIADVRAQPKALVSFSENMQQRNLQLKQFLRNNLYSHYRVFRMTNKAKNIIQNLFDALMTDTRLLPHEYADKAKQMELHEGDPGKARAVADYIAGMTDRYAITEYKRLFDPTQLT